MSEQKGPCTSHAICAAPVTQVHRAQSPCRVRQACCTFTSFPSAEVRCRPSLDSSMLVTTPAVARVRTGAATRTSQTLQDESRLYAAVRGCMQAQLGSLAESSDIISCRHVLLGNSWAKWSCGC